MKKSGVLAVILGVGMLLTSCASLDEPGAYRREHQEVLQSELKLRGDRYLGSGLSLDDCIGIGMKHNYGLRLSALQRRLAELDVNLAFSNFLPQVTLSGSYTSWRHQQTMGSSPIADRHYRNGDFSVGMPLFMPSAWLLYANRKLGLEQSALTQHIARQTVELTITSLFFSCLSCEDELVALRSQLSSAKSQFERVDAMYGEGQIRSWEREQALTQYQSFAIQVVRKERELQTTRGQLLEAMGLSPLESKRLQLLRPEGEASLGAATTESLVLQALTRHPELSIADRRVIAAENDVRTAIANFLPVVSGFVNGTWTSDSLADRASNLYGGFQATMDLFNGFAKYNTYRSAKVGREASYLNRDALFLSIMMEVITAEAQLRDAWDGWQLAQLNYRSLQAKYQDYASRYSEGLEPLYKMLDAKAEMDAAESDMIRLGYLRHIAQAQLRMAMGVIAPPKESVTPEDEKYPQRIETDELLLK